MEVQLLLVTNKLLELKWQLYSIAFTLLNLMYMRISNHQTLKNLWSKSIQNQFFPDTWFYEGQSTNTQSFSLLRGQN